MAPGATLTMTIWNRPNPLAAATAKAFARYLDEQTATNSLAPFSFSGSEKIVAVLDGAGFHDIKMTIIEVDRTLGPAKESIPNEVIGTPFGSDFLSLQESIQAAFLADITAAIEEYQDGEGFLIPQQTHLIRAKA